MTAPRDPADLAVDLASGDPERMRVGLAGLLELDKPGDEIAVPAVEPWMLQLFGATPPDDLVTAFARLLASYRSFVPQPSRAHVVRQLVELAVRHGVRQVIHEASLAIQGQADPLAAARDAIGYLHLRGLRTPREIAAAGTLISDLLEAVQPVRRAATEALAAWDPTEAKQVISAAVLGQVDADQRTLLEHPPKPARLPRMKFQDVAVNRQERYTLGTEQSSGKHYISIPVSNGLVEYSEYYEIDDDMFEKFRADLDSALPFVERCRNRQEDPRLLYQPSVKRGSPT
ncbi:MAG TPA: hypothetical protein VK607_17460 [Kofleriaceae bacterium]|nr:hypothetical protein [Kofleriaceae bacterium]HMG56846.1 hypothetical protein [Kofleriaceae bacterium]